MEGEATLLRLAFSTPTHHHLEAPWNLGGIQEEAVGESFSCEAFFTDHALVGRC